MSILRNGHVAVSNLGVKGPNSPCWNYWFNASFISRLVTAPPLERDIIDLRLSTINEGTLVLWYHRGCSLMYVQKLLQTICKTMFLLQRYMVEICPDQWPHKTLVVCVCVCVCACVCVCVLNFISNTLLIALTRLLEQISTINSFRHFLTNMTNMLRVGSL